MLPVTYSSQVPPSSDSLFFIWLGFNLFLRVLKQLWDFKIFTKPIGFWSLLVTPPDLTNLGIGPFFSTASVSSSEGRVFSEGFLNPSALSRVPFTSVPPEFPSDINILKVLGSQAQEGGSRLQGFEVGGTSHATATYVEHGQPFGEGASVLGERKKRLYKVKKQSADGCDVGYGLDHPVGGGLQQKIPGWAHMRQEIWYSFSYGGNSFSQGGWSLLCGP